MSADRMFCSRGRLLHAGWWPALGYILLHIMTTEARPIVARIPFEPLSPFLEQMIKEAKDIEVIPIDPAKVAQDLSKKVKGIIHYSVHPYRIDAKLMDLFPNLLIISNAGVGYDHIDVVAASERGIVVANTPDAPTDSTADLAFALLLASARNVVEGDKFLKRPENTQLTEIQDWCGVQVSGSTIGIVGMGKIGYTVAKRANGFDMKILYHNRNQRKCDEPQLGAQFCDKLADLLCQSDFVVLCVPLTPETTNLITARELSLMKPTATLVNVSRGGVVNHEDLTDALQNGVIRAAALDVTEPEPLPKDHTLLTLPNVIITPHIGSATKETRRKMMDILLMNLRAGLKGKKPPFAVN